MRERGVDTLLVGPSADLRYLVGYHALPLERLTLLVVPAEGEATLVAPALEAPRARSSGATDHAELATWEETDDPIALVRDLLRAAGVGEDATYAVQDRLWTSFTLRLQDALPARAWLPGSSVLRDLRIAKTPDEVAALKRVGAAIDRVHQQVPALLRPGRTEHEVGRDIAERILDEHDEVNFVIVASGPNGASPHHETGSRVLEPGDAVVVDIGGTREGYCSDMTRNYTLGPADPAYRELHDVLEASQVAATEVVRPGIEAHEVDRVARRIITEAGWGPQFLHRTGHGIGVEEHEEPWIVEGNDEPLVPGMAFSVEPGIYVADRWGARIEDIVVVTEDGADRCNLLPRGLVEVDL
jgi:Xaa-Pro aminopeptidase